MHVTGAAATAAAFLAAAAHAAGARQTIQLKSLQHTSVNLCVGAHRAASNIVSSCCLLMAPGSPAQHAQLSME
jgi:hypothetical protein